MNTNDQDLDGKVANNENNDSKLVRLIKSVVVNPEKGKYVDEKIVRFKFYNSFNYSLLSRGNENLNMTVGITSPKQGEGKTLVASNLAVSLAMGSQKKTVLVDLNILNPSLHNVFGVPQSPGLGEAFTNGKVHVYQTAIENLAVLTSGHFLGTQSEWPLPEGSMRGIMKPALGLDQLAAFRDVIYSLEQEFEFVIVDMPSINTEGVPVLFANQLNGLIVVVDSGRTKKEELDAMFHQVNERQVLGFVFNRFEEHH